MHLQITMGGGLKILKSKQRSHNFYKSTRSDHQYRNKTIQTHWSGRKEGGLGHLMVLAA